MEATATLTIDPEFRKQNADYEHTTSARCRGFLFPAQPKPGHTMPEGQWPGLLYVTHCESASASVYCPLN